MTASRDELHHLIDELPDDQVSVAADDVVVVAKEQLGEPLWTVDQATLVQLGQLLASALAPGQQAKRGQLGWRPPTYPRPNSLRFADLRIPGETNKPVVVISTETYGERAQYAFVIACRVTSNPAPVREFDVLLTSQTGKAVCSAIQTVPFDAIEDRAPRGAAYVSAKEAAAILRKVWTLLDLP